MSKCFEIGKGFSSNRTFASEKKRAEPDEFERERVRQRMNNCCVEYENPEQYVEFKLEMLRKEMYIDPTLEEIAHLKSLDSELRIDNAVRSIIERHWS